MAGGDPGRWVPRARRLRGRRRWTECRPVSPGCNTKTNLAGIPTGRDPVFRTGAPTATAAPWPCAGPLHREAREVRAVGQRTACSSCRSIRPVHARFLPPVRQRARGGPTRRVRKSARRARSAAQTAAAWDRAGIALASARREFLRQDLPIGGPGSIQRVEQSLLRDVGRARLNTTKTSGLPLVRPDRRGSPRPGPSVVGEPAGHQSRSGSRRRRDSCGRPPARDRRCSRDSRARRSSSKLPGAVFPPRDKPRPLRAGSPLRRRCTGPWRRPGASML